ncbi:hypothetical protein CH63R_11596 [Colletotrichum higginsianum IMI 349063]|uniref:Uncharacterized protein n=1 Tax=Colletotrichum higginsianum (strain IMI 349063) TaxID=759273 RepID=A0A1B7XYN7_COLHI|nr:hypothetical protein CH63R_11596 [Colletotrichum higginsianum IMI 349063]OBR04893.1 hypothetical protein CH63R_11596 [Colletotrichum higginsianum IMI 349063]
MPTTRHASFARQVETPQKVDTLSTSLVAHNRTAKLNRLSRPEDKLTAQSLLNEYTKFLGSPKTRVLFREASKLPELQFRDFVSDLPAPAFIRTTDLGAEIESLQRALAYFSQTVSGVPNGVFDHVGAVGCDVVQKGDGSDRKSTLNLRLAKNKGIQEEDFKFFGILLGLLNGTSRNVPSDEVERLSLRHPLVRINYDVNRIYKQTRENTGSSPKPCLGTKTTDKRSGKDYMTVLTWLLEEYEPEELHCLGMNRRIVIRKCGAQSTHGTTEIAQISVGQIMPDSSLSSTHLLRLHRASQAAVRLLRNQIASDIRDGLRRLLECLQSSNKPPNLCGVKEEELIQSFPSVLTCIAEPLTHLEVIAGFLPRYYRSRHADDDDDGGPKVDVRFFALTAPNNQVIHGRGKAMSRLTHCEMQVLDHYLLQRRPDNQLQGTRTLVGKFIGISKVCCPLCSIVMWTLTGVFAVDGSHDDLSVWWTLPLFLFCEDGLFSEHRRCFFRVVAHWADKHGYQPNSAWQ